MGRNLPPGVSVSDLPGNEPVPEEAPHCLLCLEEDERPWDVMVSGTADGEEPEAECQRHGVLAPENWEMRKI